MTDEKPFLISRSDFLRDIGRSDMYYRDHQFDPDHRPPLPRTVKQGRSNFIVREDAERYKREFSRLAGVPQRDRPPKRTTIEAAE
jgi:hypothetical protein